MLDATDDRPAPPTPSSGERSESTPGAGTRSQDQQAGGVEHHVSCSCCGDQNPLHCWCEIRFLAASLEVVTKGADLLLRYAIATEHHGLVFGACEVEIGGVGRGRDYDYSCHYLRTVEGPELPQSFHGDVEEAAGEAWGVWYDEGEGGIDAYNRRLAVAYTAWRAHDAELTETVRMPSMTIREAGEEAWRKLAEDTGAEL